MKCGFLQSMIILKGFKNGAEIYYTGCAGDNWISEDITKAWKFNSESSALYSQDLFNNRTVLTRIHWVVKVI